MTQPQSEYNVQAEADEAMEMLRKGYDYPSIEIEPERTVIERRGGELKEVVKPAFIKVSTSFKSELVNISDAALKVWIFISLSINRNTGTANPGLRTIAKALGKGVNTIQECLTELEAAKLLTVDRQSRKYNIYEPTAYVSANRQDPVSGSDTDGQTVSEKIETVSENRQSVSDSRILNQRNQREPDPFFEVLTKPSHNELQEQEATRMFERAFGYGSLPWHSTKAWTKMAKFVTAIFERDRLAFGNYIVWRGGEGKYKAMNNKQIRLNPEVFIDTGWAEFESQEQNKPVEYTRLL